MRKHSSLDDKAAGCALSEDVDVDRRAHVVVKATSLQTENALVCCNVNNSRLHAYDDSARQNASRVVGRIFLLFFFFRADTRQANKFSKFEIIMKLVESLRRKRACSFFFQKRIRAKYNYNIKKYSHKKSSTFRAASKHKHQSSASVPCVEML